MRTSQMSLIHEIDFGTPRSKTEKTVTLTIDGVAVTVPEGTSIMRAAVELGREIPKLCATDMVEAFGSCEAQRADEVVPGIANHIKKFWDPRMRDAIFAYMDAGGEGIDPPVREALDKLKAAGHRTKAGLDDRSSFQGT